MKVVMVMAPSINGYIAKEDFDESWVKAASWSRFKRISKQIGNLIMGERTYEVMLAAGEFPLPGRLNVVGTNKAIKNKWGEDKVIFTDKSPKQILAMLEAKGFKTACVAGGGINNANFMRAGLVDELLLDIQPRVFGKGIKLFADADFDYGLKLLSIKKVSRDELQLHYKVLK